MFWSAAFLSLIQSTGICLPLFQSKVTWSLCNCSSYLLIIGHGEIYYSNLKSSVDLETVKIKEKELKANKHTQNQLTDQTQKS